MKYLKVAIPNNSIPFVTIGITKEVTADPEVSGSDIADRINEDFLQTPWAAR